MLVAMGPIEWVLFAMIVLIAVSSALTSLIYGFLFTFAAFKVLFLILTAPWQWPPKK